MKKISLLIISLVCFINTYAQTDTTYKVDFYADITYGVAPCVVTFIDTSKLCVNWIWYFGDGEEGDDHFTNPVSHTYDTAGVYTVTLRVHLWDGSWKTIVKKNYITIVEKDNIVENKWENIQFYPNPCHTTLKITSNQSFSTYSIKDVNGKECVSTSPFTDCIDVSTLAKGIYFIVLQNKKKNVVQKFIVE